LEEGPEALKTIETVENVNQLLSKQVLSPSKLAETQPNNSSVGQTGRDIQIEKTASFASFGMRQERSESSEAESIELSQGSSKDKFKSIEVVRQLHADGKVIDERETERRLHSSPSSHQSSQKRASPLSRHLNFAKSDSQSSIIEIHKFQQFKD